MLTEDGCKGFLGQSLYKALSQLGITKVARSRAKMARTSQRQQKKILEMALD